MFQCILMYGTYMCTRVCVSLVSTEKTFHFSDMASIKERNFFRKLKFCMKSWKSILPEESTSIFSRKWLRLNQSDSCVERKSLSYRGKLNYVYFFDNNVTLSTSIQYTNTICNGKCCHLSPIRGDAHTHKYKHMYTIDMWWLRVPLSYLTSVFYSRVRVKETVRKRIYVYICIHIVLYSSIFSLPCHVC